MNCAPPAARGDPRRGLPRRAARARRGRRQVGRDLCGGLLAESRILRVLPQHGGVPLDLPRPQRHHAARDQLGLPALLQGLAGQTGAKTAGAAREVGLGHDVPDGVRPDARARRRPALRRADALARDLPPHHPDERRPDPLRRAVVDHRRAAAALLGPLMKWVLPEYVEDILPVEAMRIERLRRAILDLFFKNEYQLVMPPLLEYMDSLLTGTGHDLELRTFKVVDQLSGRTMGVRADITPQVARIDAHLLNRRGVTRLCYCGSVLHTRPASPGATREPIQIGAEMYGHDGVAADLEMQKLLCAALKLAKVRGARLDIGHVAVFRSLVRAAKVPAELEAELFEALQKKDVPELKKL